MATIRALQEYGNQIAILMTDGTKHLAYPTSGGLWLPKNGVQTNNPQDPDIPPVEPYDPPETGAGVLFNPWAGMDNQYNWEAHRTYSQGGYDLPLAFGTLLEMPTDGILRAGTWTDAAGRRQQLDLRNAFYRVKPRSLTPMGPAKTIEAEGPMTSIVFQHLSEFGAVGDYDGGQTGPKSGASAQPYKGEYGGDVHLHIHGLDRAGSRLDFWKFF